MNKLQHNYIKYVHFFLILCLGTTLQPLLASKFSAPGLIEKLYENLQNKFESPYSRVSISINKNVWQHAESKHFVFHYSNKTHLLKAFHEGKSYLNIIALDLGQRQIPENMDKFHIWIFPNSETWSIFCNQIKHNPKSYGFTPHNYRELFINFSSLGRKGSALLAHELTHLLLGSIYSPKLPIWFHEGFAQYEEDEAYARLRNVRVNPDYIIAYNRNIIPLTELVNLKDYPASEFGQNSDVIYYNQSELLIRFILEQYDLKRLLVLGQALSQGLSFEQSTKKTLNITDYDTFQKQYEETCKKRLR